MNNARSGPVHPEVAMHPLFSRFVRLSLAMSLASVTLFSLPARAQSTTWFGSTGNWGVPANWSNGEPTANVDAILTASGTAQVTMGGETCRNLLGGTVSITTGGSLNVIHRIQAITITQNGGTVSADSLVIGQYLMFNGTLMVNHLVIGTAAPSSGNFSSSAMNPTVTVAHSLVIGRGANIVSGAGTLTVGTSSADSLVVLGAYQMANRPTQNVRNFVMRPLAALNVTILFNGVTPVVSSGAAILDGTLTVSDLSAPNGTYELVRGSPISGAFDTVNLPTAGEWSWRIDGNSLLVTKGPVAVEPTTWSRVKVEVGE